MENRKVCKRSTFSLSVDEYRQLTANLFEVVETHQQLLRLLDEEEQKASDEQRVGRLFLAWAPRVKSVHQGYCSLHPRAAFILEKYRYLLLIPTVHENLLFF